MRSQEKTIFELALEWAEENFEALESDAWSAEHLQQECMRLSNEEYQGESTKCWLFIYSPSSVNPLFEVGGGISRWMMGMTKLITVAEQGGMLFGADFSKGWGTPNCVGKFKPLAVSEF